MTDLEICQSVEAKDILEISDKLNIDSKSLTCYGRDKAKISLDLLKNKPKGKLILVTAINPTPAGEGKTTVTIGLADALNRLDREAMVCLREPSLGPVMGLKGGACGGGYAQVIPMEDINLHFTGDLHAITAANNLICAIIDNSIMRDNPLNIDPNRVAIHRVMDMNDRALRNITIANGGGKMNGVTRPDHFDITVASEVMAVLCLAKNEEDFKKRISNMLVAYTYDNKPVYVKDLGVEGAVSLLMKDALKPNLVQTLEGTPVLIHGGPFANIAHGCNSVIATKMGLGLSDYVVTEAGFGADLGAEKFLDIKCQSANLKPSAVVVVATIRALKMHGGVLKEDLAFENVDALLKGVSNLEKHCENISKYNLPFVIAINRFNTDTDLEIEALTNWANSKGYSISLTDVYNKGGAGALDLGGKLLNILDDSKFKPIYSLAMSVEEKINRVAKEIYGASEIEYTSDALEDLKMLKELSLDSLPICMAKTQYSLSDNPKLLGRPRDFTITIKRLLPQIGAGFIVVMLGDIIRMPGLPAKPAALEMDLIDGKAKGLF